MNDSNSFLATHTGSRWVTSECYRQQILLITEDTLQVFQRLMVLHTKNKSISLGYSSPSDVVASPEILSTNIGTAFVKVYTSEGSGCVSLWRSIPWSLLLIHHFDSASTNQKYVGILVVGMIMSKLHLIS